MSTDEPKLKTVAVLGGSYGGNRAAQVLAAGLPDGWRVVLVDRNSHFNHVYNFPRYTVLPGHEHKAFIPYDNLFHNPSDPASSSHPHKRVHGTITSLHEHYITYTSHADSGPATSTTLGSLPVQTVEEQTLHFDYAVYALGSQLPSPIALWESHDTNFSSLKAQGPACSDMKKGSQCSNRIRRYVGTKQESISRLRCRQQTIEAAHRVLVVGGGALGIQFASDIAAVYPRKSVTLLHSRSRLLPRFNEALGDEVYQGLQELGVRVILGERLDMSSFDDKVNPFGSQGTTLMKTIKGREIEADLVLLCTGQKPSTSLLHAMDSRTVDPESGMVRVSPTMQILALIEKDTTLGEGELDIRPVTETSPTLCGTAPLSSIDMLVELRSALLAPTCNASAHEMLVESEADACYDPYTFIYPHLFAIGDAADAFGACKAGHTAYYQGEVAARNVIKLIRGNATALGLPFWGLMLTAGEGGMKDGAEGDSEGIELEEYIPGLPMIKVSLGLTKSAYEVAGVVGTRDDGTEDLGAAIAWGAYGYTNMPGQEGMWI